MMIPSPKTKVEGAVATGIHLDATHEIRGGVSLVALRDSLLSYTYKKRRSSDGSALRPVR